MKPGWGRADTAAPNLSHPRYRCQVGTVRAADTRGTDAMATAAEPRPAELPLPGGRKGATVRVRPLMSGRLSSPPAAFHREEGRLAGP